MATTIGIRDDEMFALAMEIGEASGLKLEIAGGVPTWEAFPNLRHQRAVDIIRATIRRATNHGVANGSGGGSGCACIHVADIYVRFTDGSLKRPDIAIFSREPDEDVEAVTLLPEAVIEIVSAGYEAKDLEIGVPFYLRMGVRDVVVFDPATGVVRHFRPDQPEAVYASPVALTFACGCVATV